MTCPYCHSDDGDWFLDPPRMISKDGIRKHGKLLFLKLVFLFDLVGFFYYLSERFSLGGF